MEANAAATCPAHEFRRHFCAIRIGKAREEQQELPVFSGWYKADCKMFYTALFNSNRERTVHLGVKLHLAETGALTQRIDVLWDMAANTLGAYTDPSYMGRVRADLEAIFQGAEVKGVSFSDMLAHYTAPDLSRPDGDVRASVSRVASAERDVGVYFIPANVDVANVHHYAAMCKHGWTRVSQGKPSGACAALFKKAMIMRADAGARSRTPPPSRVVPMLTARFREAPEREVAYMSCSFWVKCTNYSAASQTIEFLVMGVFSDADPSTPYSDLPFTARFCWDLRCGAVYFPDGSLRRSASFGSGGGDARRVAQCWLFRRHDFSSFLQELYGWNIPRVLWEDKEAVHFAREIVGGLEWLGAFREATRGRLPDNVYDRIGLTEVPTGVRRAYELGDVMPVAPAPAKRARR